MNDSQKITLAIESMNDGSTLAAAAERYKVSQSKIQSVIDYWNSEEGQNETESADGHWFIN